MKVFILLCLLAGTAYANVFGRLSYDTAPDSWEEYPSYKVQTKYVPREIFDENIEDDPRFTGIDDSMPTLKLFAVAPKVAKPTKKPKKTKEIVVLDPVDQIAALKAECKTKFDDLTTEFETKLNDTATKYQTKYEKLVAINPDETLPEYGLLQSEFASKIDLATQKFNLKEATLISKYKTQIDALQAQIDAQPSTTPVDLVENDNEAASFGAVPSIFPGQPGPVLIDSEVADKDFGATLDYSRDDDVSTEHALGFQTPMLRLPKVKTTALPVVTTPKVPTIADAYWKAWGAKIGEVFNKTKATTETSGVIVATEDSVATAPTTPLPPTFWMTFGKTMGKAFADAKFKIMTTVKATTVAPLVPLDDDIMGIPDTTTEFVVDDAFWDEFGSSLGDALANKAIFDAMKTSTVPSVDTAITDDSVISPDDFDYSHDLDSAVPTLRLGEPVAAPVTPVTVPGLYWKTFGDKIKDSFNKSKIATTDSPVDGTAPVAPVAPTFWMDFGKSIGKALTDAKFKLVSVTKPVIPTTPLNPLAPSTPTVPDFDDAEFFDTFGSQLDSVLAAKNAAMTPTTPVPITPDAVSHDLPYEAPKLFMVSPPQTPVTPVSPYGLYWKNYGDQIAGQFIPPYSPMTYPGYSPMAYPGYSPMGYPTPSPVPNPALYWKGYGSQIAGHFAAAKQPFMPFYYSPPATQPSQYGYEQPMGFEDTSDDDYVYAHSIPSQQKLNLRFTRDLDATVNPWASYGAGIKANFQDAKMRTYDDINRAKFEQPIFDVNADAATFPATQANYWSAFGTRIKDNFNKAKTQVSGYVI